MADTKIGSVLFGGGLNYSAPELAVPPGAMLACQNYEPADAGGYRICDGFERFDGQPRPSEVLFTVISVENTVTDVVTGNVVTGVTSGASGIAVDDQYVDLDGNDSIVLYVTSTANFQDAEELQVAAAKVSDSVTVQSLGNGASSLTEFDTWRVACQELARALIGPVPGEGDILGVWSYKGIVYAFRNAVGGATANMYKSTTSGWALVSLGVVLDFDAGTSEITAGETITGAVTGHAGLVKYAIVTSGTYSGGDAAGYLVFDTTTGVFQNNEALNGSVAGAACALADGTAVVPTLLPDGRYEFVNYNFSDIENPGPDATLKMYGCDGVNPGFQWDGTNFVQIRTGMPIDVPDHIEAHRNHLFFSFGSSMQHSGIWSPLIWTILTGADELGFGDHITGMTSLPNGSMSIFARSSMAIMVGSSALNWDVKMFSSQYGAKEWTIQNTIAPMFMSDSGLSVLPDTDKFGEFSGETISEAVKPLIDAYADLSRCSVAFRKKNQYRLFYTNGDALLLKTNGKEIMGYSLMSYPFPVRTVSASVRSDRYLTDTLVEKDHVFFGSDGTEGGYVYQMDSGRSYDGENMTAFWRMPYNHFDTPRQRKQFRKYVFEILTEGAGLSNLYFSPDYKLFNRRVPTAANTFLQTDLVGANWNEGFWGEFFWAGEDADNFYEVRLEGVGCGVGGVIWFHGKDVRPHTIKMGIIHYDDRGMVK